MLLTGSKSRNLNSRVKAHQERDKTSGGPVIVENRISLCGGIMDGVISTNWRSCGGDGGRKDCSKKLDEKHDEDGYFTMEEISVKRMMMLRLTENPSRNARTAVNIIT